MQNIAMRFRAGGLCLALLFLTLGVAKSHAQATPEILPTKPATPEDLSQTELLKSYLRLQEQLHAAQLAIVNNRLEAEATARAQAQAITEKLDSIKATMTAERERQQLEAQRLQAERERQQ